MKTRKRFLFGVSTTAVAVVLAVFWATEEQAADPPVTHNMLVVGEETDALPDCRPQ